MSILETIQKQRQEARSSKERAVEASILTLLVGELETISTRDKLEVTNDLAYGVIKKLIKSNKETISLKGADKSEKLIQENQILVQLLPENMRGDMSEATILAHIEASGASDMKGIIGYLKQNFDGQYDPKVASQLAKQYLAK